MIIDDENTCFNFENNEHIYKDDPLDNTKINYYTS